MTDVSLTGVGETLARGREMQGLSLADVAAQLKFATRQIEALEQERFEALPGPTIARGMVRNYARLLKLDPEPLLEQLSGRVRTPDAEELAARFRQPVPFSDSGRRSTMLYLLLSLGVLGLVGAVAYEWRNEATSQTVAAIPPKPMEPLIAAESVASAPVAPAPAAEEAPRGKSAKPAATPGANTARKDAAAEPKAAVEKKEAAPEREQLALKTMSGNRIVLRCEEESWIEVKDSADRLLISSLHPAGTERVVEGRPPFTLVIGNAQHVRVRYNDRLVDLGPHTKVEVARLTLK